jgi:hypothetical protein
VDGLAAPVGLGGEVGGGRAELPGGTAAQEKDVEAVEGYR